MKPLPAPHVPGKTDFERFDNAVRHIFTIPKGDVVKAKPPKKKKPTKKRK
jgi:hypothetical protein